VSRPRSGWLRGNAFLLAGLCLVGSACGGGDPASEVNSDDISRELRREHRDERRLDELERRIARLRQRELRERPSRGRESNVPVSKGLASTVGDLAGEVGVAVGDLGGRSVQAAGDLSTGSAWSTIKVPIALALMREVGGPSKLTSAQASQIEAAITLSDNAAAAALFAELERRHGGVAGAAASVTQVLRAAGDTSTVVSTRGRNGFSPYGQTDWSLANQQRFVGSLASGCLGDQASTNLLLDLMGRVTSDRWGLGSIGLPARWKGGWGPGTDGRYLVRQMGIIQRRGQPIAIAIAARAADGQFLSGQTLASQLAQRVVQASLPDQPSVRSC
jgi:beta-lactamase class A